MAGFPVANTVINGGGFPVSSSTGTPIVFEKAGTGTFSVSPATVTLPQATALNDCIVICIAMQGTAAVTVAGAGATWTEAVTEPGSGPGCYIWVGYAAAAGQTTITVTFTGSDGAYSLGMFSGVMHTASPVVVGAGNTSAPSAVGTLTTTSETYTTGQLVLACVATFNATFSATTWLHGVATNSLGVVNGATRSVAADYFVAASGNSNAATFTWSTSTNISQAGIVVLSQGP